MVQIEIEFAKVNPGGLVVMSDSIYDCPGLDQIPVDGVSQVIQVQASEDAVPICATALTAVEI